MITINSFRFNSYSDTTRLELNAIATSSAILSIQIWKAADFLSVSKGYKANNPLPSNTIRLNSDITDQYLMEPDQLYIIEIQSEAETAYGVYGNLTKHALQIVDQVLSIKIDNCQPSQDMTCKEFLDCCNNNIFYINALFQSLLLSLQLVIPNDIQGVQRVVTAFRKLKDYMTFCCYDKSTTEDFLLITQDNKYVIA